MPEIADRAKVLRGSCVNVYAHFLYGRDAMRPAKTSLRVLIGLSLIVLFVSGSLIAQTSRWGSEKAKTWYREQGWLVGSNYIPTDAINELEMWQVQSFNPGQVDKELGWAESIGMNTMRVFLHDLLWQENPEGFKQRINQFLEISARHHIRPLFVLFDSCWDPQPRLGVQHPPIPGVHNSGWVQSPGAAALSDPAQEGRLKAYVTGVVGAFANDARVLGWDVWNEPSNTNQGSYHRLEPPNKPQIVEALLPKVFAWAREAHPSQPLTSGVWDIDFENGTPLTKTQQTQLDNSDVITFHNYGWPESFEKEVQYLQKFDRPVICSEFMARSAGSTFDTVLPIAKKYMVGAINWGFVAGKTQTYYPWDSWRHPYILDQPTVWFHEVLHPDGKPYREAEVQLIRELTGHGSSSARGGNSR
jgi:Cellulase (glycosyl hydrolase family 5)